MDRKSVKTKI